MSKRNPRNTPPKCRVGNYGLARKKSLLNIAYRTYQQNYKIYKTENTEWLESNTELIGVEKKHKRDLGIVLDRFFEPCYNDASESQPKLDKVDISAAKISSFVSDQPRQRWGTKNRLFCLLHSDQVRLIDSQELKQRLLNSKRQIVSFNYKIEKKKKFGKSTVIGVKKPSPLEVLRASNRPKSTLKPRQKYNSSSSRIIHKQDSKVLPLHEDVLKFYQPSNNATTESLIQKKLDQSDLEKKPAGKIGTENTEKKLKMWKYALKERRSQASMKDNTNMDRNGACPKPNKSKYALNIQLDKMNKKIPVGNAKKKGLAVKMWTSSVQNKANQSGPKPRAEPTALGIGKVIGKKAKQANMEMKTCSERLQVGEGRPYLEDYLYDGDVEDQEIPEVHATGEHKQIRKEVKIDIVKKIYRNGVVDLASYYLKKFLFGANVEGLVQENPEEYVMRERKKMGKEININRKKKTKGNNEGLVIGNRKDLQTDEGKEIGKEKKINIEMKTSESDEGLQAEEEWHYLVDFLYDSGIDNLMEEPEEPEEYAKQLQDISEKIRSINIANTMDMNQKSEENMEESDTETLVNTPRSYEEEQAGRASCRSKESRTAGVEDLKSTKPSFADFSEKDNMVQLRMSSLRPNQLVVIEPIKVQFAEILPSPRVGVRFEYDPSHLPRNPFRHLQRVEPPPCHDSPCETFLKILSLIQIVIFVPFLLFNAILCLMS